MHFVYRKDHQKLILNSFICTLEVVIIRSSFVPMWKNISNFRISSFNSLFYTEGEWDRCVQMYLWHLMEMRPKFRANAALQLFSWDSRLISVKTAENKMKKKKNNPASLLSCVGTHMVFLRQGTVFHLPPGLESKCYHYLPSSQNKGNGERRSWWCCKGALKSVCATT